MKYSESIKAKLLATIHEIAADPSKYAVNPRKDFTRNRKIGFKQLLLMFLTMEGNCIKEELYRYFGRTTDAPSKLLFISSDKNLEKMPYEIFFLLLTKNSKKLFIIESISL